MKKKKYYNTVYSKYCKCFFFPFTQEVSPILKLSSICKEKGKYGMTCWKEEHKKGERGVRQRGTT
jgi:hypothetical protein